MKGWSQEGLKILFGRFMGAYRIEFVGRDGLGLKILLRFFQGYLGFEHFVEINLGCLVMTYKYASGSNFFHEFRFSSRF